jgi:hypothetical protein
MGDQETKQRDAISRIKAAGKDYYKILDVPKSADIDVIKKAYK